MSRSRTRPPWFPSPIVCLSVLALTASVPASAGNGDLIGGYPSYFERAMLALTNACRQGPQTYRDTYLPGYPSILQPQNYPAQPPLYWSYALNQAARAHCTDMATWPCFQHSSCDGTPWVTRIQSYYTESGYLGENIAAGYSTPFATVNAWLIDGGAQDLDPGLLDGHRRNIMTAGFREMGNGYAYLAAAPHDHYWTQDFGGGAADFTSPLVWGSHVFTGDGNVTFLANYYSAANQAPLEASLVIGGTSYAMTSFFGTSARGTYRTSLPIGTGCRSYYFRIKDAGGTVWLHPEGGWLSTTGEGGCTTEYTAGSVAVDGPDAGELRLAVSPNPTVGGATVRFRAAAAGQASIRITDLSGRLVREVSLAVAGGPASWTWDGLDARGHRPAAGVYFLSVQAGATRTTSRLVVLVGAR